ncbi:MAG: carbohydrate-binding protein [Planctomycetes bacterium]|nr:carbohydrate-binding protein [Planctomycetota bacterium]
MNVADLKVQVERAQQGDPAAFHELVTATIGDLRLYIATYVSTQALGDALLREVYGAIRRELSRCPPQDVRGWMCRTASTLIGIRLSDATRGAAAAKDPLNTIVVQSAVDALGRNSDAANPAAVELPRRLQMQPPSLRQLLQRHYNEGLTVGTIAEKQGLVESEVAQALLAARARMDWTGVAEVGDTADRTFPSVIEDYLGGTLVPDTRALLVAGVLHDPARATQFERQVRLHLLLQALLTPFDAAQVKEFIAGLPHFQNDSSRLIVPQRPTRGTARITRQPPAPRSDTTRHRRQISETGSGVRGFAGTASGTRKTAVAEADDLGDDAPPPPNRMPLYLGGGAAVLGLLVLMVIWLRPASPTHADELVAPAPTQQAPVGDPSFALVSEVEGQAVITHAGQTRPAIISESLSSGDGLQVTGAGILRTLLVDQVRLKLFADTQIQTVTLQGQTLHLHLTQGQAEIEHLRGPKVTTVIARTPQGQVTMAEAKTTIDVVDGVTRVRTGRGKPQVARLNGAGMVEAAPGGVVVVRAGADPAVDGGGAFVRGINFGEGVVTIARNQWLSLNEALGAGLTLGRGVRVGPFAQISGVGMDFDTKRMLDAGLVGDGGQIELSHVLPNGDYDLSLWIAGPVDARFDGITLTLANTPVPLGPAATKAERWRRLGPLRVQVRQRRLDLRLSGMGAAHLAGLQLDAIGTLDGVLPPMILITDPASGGQAPPFDLTIRTRADAAGGIAKVAFYNRDTLLGEATTPPYTFTWRAPPIGAYALSAVATDASGGTSRSAVVEGTVQDFASLRGLLRETWRGIGGGGIGDLRGHLASPAHEITLVPHSDYRISGNDFGARLRALLTPPADGDYIIEVLSDDSSEVWLSPDENPANRRLVCSLNGYGDPNQWDRHPSQRSTPIALTGGQRCFIEVLYKQGGGGAHLLLGWVRPDGVTERPIQAERFTPVQTGMQVPPPSTTGMPPTTQTPTSTAPVTNTAGRPAVMPRDIPQLPDGPQLKGAVAPSPQVVNLSDVGAMDWIQYGITDEKSFNRRQGGEQLSVARAADNADIRRYDNNRTRFAWNDGTPTVVSAATNTGWWVDNRSKGFTFTAPADPVLRRLMVWVGGDKTQGSFNATLSDGSAPPYRDESVNTGDGKGWHCYTLLYRARSNGAKLTITWNAAKVQDGNVTLQAVALSEFSDGKPRFIKGINLGGDGAAILGNTWLGQKEAESAGLVIYNSRRINGSGEPVPATDPATRSMLRSGVAAKSGDLEIADRGLSNGRFDVTLYVSETSASNSRQFDVMVNEVELKDIGQLTKNGWAAYGPVTTEVTKGALAIIAKAQKGAPQVMGIAIYASGDDGGPWTNAFPAGRAHELPGTLLFADFDRGVNGVAFQERDDKPRNPFYRTEPVGINQYHGAPVVAYVPNGEWLRYTVNVKEAGTYTVTVKYGKANGGDPKNARVQFEVDGLAVGGELRLEDTQRWDNAKTVTSQAFQMTAGIHDLRALFFGEQDELADFWSFEFKKL